MSNLMHYKGYYSSIKFSEEDNVFYGKIDDIRSLILFEGIDVVSLENAFHEFVDDYLETCKEMGIEPEKPCESKRKLIEDALEHDEDIALSRLAEMIDTGKQKIISHENAWK